MRAFTTVTRERGVVTIPVELREAAGITPSTPLTWVEIESGLWLVGRQERRPEEIAPTVASALRTEQSPFPKLMARFFAGEAPQRVGRGRRPRSRPERPPELTEDHMIALGARTSAPRWRRGRP